MTTINSAHGYSRKASEKQMAYLATLAFNKSLNGKQWVMELRARIEAGVANFDTRNASKVIDELKHEIYARETASEKQIAFVTSLYNERAHMGDNIYVMLSKTVIDGQGENLTKAAANDIIYALKRIAIARKPEAL